MERQGHGNPQGERGQEGKGPRRHHHGLEWQPEVACPQLLAKYDGLRSSGGRRAYGSGFSLWVVLLSAGRNAMGIQGAAVVPGYLQAVQTSPLATIRPSTRDAGR